MLPLASHVLPYRAKGRCSPPIVQGQNPCRNFFLCFKLFSFLSDSLPSTIFVIFSTGSFPVEKLECIALLKRKNPILFHLWLFFLPCSISFYTVILFLSSHLFFNLQSSLFEVIEIMQAQVTNVFSFFRHNGSILTFILPNILKKWYCWQLLLKLSHTLMITSAFLSLWALLSFILYIYQLKYL